MTRGVAAVGLVISFTCLILGCQATPAAQSVQAEEAVMQTRGCETASIEAFTEDQGKGISIQFDVQPDDVPEDGAYVYDTALYKL